MRSTRFERRRSGRNWTFAKVERKREIDRPLSSRGWHNTLASDFRLGVAVFLRDTASGVGSSRVRDTRIEGEREKSSRSPSPSQSGVSDSRSAASTPTVGTLTLQILIRLARGNRALLTLDTSAYLNFSNVPFRGFLFALPVFFLFSSYLYFLP